MSALIGYEELKSKTQCKSKRSLISHLRSKNVRFVVAPNGCPYTTVDAFNRALQLNDEQEGQEPIL